MLIKFEESGSNEAFLKLITTFEQQQNIKSLIIFACDNNNYTTEVLNLSLKQSTLRIIGGIFPYIIYENKLYSKGVIFIGLDQLISTAVLPNLHNTFDLEALIESQIPAMENCKTMFVFIDGMVSKIGLLLESIFNILGLEFNYVGGGAGSLSFIQKPCIFTNEGLLSDCAIIGAVDFNSFIGVSHGWTEISGPLKVTESEGSIIKTLDWIPAYELYSNIIETHSGVQFTENNFFEIAKNYPLGIAKYKSEYVARAPMFIGPNDSIRCAGEIPEGEFVHVLCGTPAALINAAKRAYLKASPPDSYIMSSGLTILIDCISRYLFLNNAFESEIMAAKNPHNSLVGILTLGEIANSRKDYLEFYNNTIVVCNMDMK